MLFKRKQKKLTLRQVHELYLLLHHALPEKEEKFLIDEIGAMINKMKSGDVLYQAIEIMYPKTKFNKKNSLEVLSLFAQGLTKNNFFDYVSFIGKINGRRKS